MCLAQGPQRSDAGEARTRGPSVSSQALYHWATALPFYDNKKWKWQYINVKYEQLERRTLMNGSRDHVDAFLTMTMKKLSNPSI